MAKSVNQGLISLVRELIEYFLLMEVFILKSCSSLNFLYVRLMNMMLG